MSDSKPETVATEPLAEVAAALQAGRRDPVSYVESRHDRVEAVEPAVRAWVDGPKPRRWTTAEAAALADRHPLPDGRPPLFGVPVGVKDIVHVDGLPTRAGSALPPGELVGPEATVVRRLRAAGAFVAGKTVTTEFAWMAPGPTRNPHDTAHTPGGSSSGSAAAVAAGMVPLAVGSQTIGSVVRPAAFCGVVGFKPTYGRLPLDGIVPVAPSVDHLGLFTSDIAGMELAAGACVDDWGHADGRPDPDKARMGVPDGAYLEQATSTGRAAFERAVDRLIDEGFDVERVPVLDGIDTVNDRHEDLVAAEAALAHEAWFESYGDRYADATAALIKTGRSVTAGRLAAARRSREELRDRLEGTLTDHDLDVWLSPAAPGPAPEGTDDTGDPVMNLPWTHAGLPTVSLPAGEAEGLPVGIQCAARFGDDERLLTWGKQLAASLDGS